MQISIAMLNIDCKWNRSYTFKPLPFLSKSRCILGSIVVNHIHHDYVYLKCHFFLASCLPIHSLSLILWHFHSILIQHNKEKKSKEELKKGNNIQMARNWLHLWNDCNASITFISTYNHTHTYAYSDSLKWYINKIKSTINTPFNRSVTFINRITALYGMQFIFIIYLYFYSLFTFSFKSESVWWIFN